MGTELTDSDKRQVLRGAFDALVARTPDGPDDWPPLVARVRLEPADVGVRWAWRMLAAAAVAGLAFLAGWTVRPSARTVATDTFAMQDEVSVTESAVTESATAGIAFSNSTDAAIAAAIAQDPSIAEPRVTRSVVIFTDDSWVDLRVEVQADGFCYWYGISGRVEDGSIVWRGGPAGQCEN